MFEEFKEEAADYVRFAYYFSSAASANGQRRTSALEWVKVYRLLDECERDCVQMLGSLRLDHALLFRIYHLMKVIRPRWLRYRARDFSVGLEPEGRCATDAIDEGAQGVFHEEEKKIERLLTNIKKMLVASH